MNINNLILKWPWGSPRDVRCAISQEFRAELFPPPPPPLRRDPCLKERDRGRKRLRRFGWLAELDGILVLVPVW